MWAWTREFSSPGTREELCEVTALVLLAPAWTLALTNHVSAEVVERVDLEGALPAILLHHHSPEVLGEQLVVGPQVQAEVSGAHRRCDGQDAQ